MKTITFFSGIFFFVKTKIGYFIGAFFCDNNQKRGNQTRNFKKMISNKKYCDMCLK